MNRRQFIGTLTASGIAGGAFNTSVFAQETAMTLTPFTISVPQQALDDLKTRLRLTRWPDAPSGAGWMLGTNLAYMQRLTEYWQDGFDWRAAEAALNALPQFKVVLDGIDLHFVHKSSAKADARALLLLHGWPNCRRWTKRLLVRFPRLLRPANAVLVASQTFSMAEFRGSAILAKLAAAGLLSTNAL